MADFDWNKYEDEFDWDKYENKKNEPNQENNQLNEFFKKGVRETSKNFLSQIFGNIGSNLPVPYGKEIGEKIGLGAIPFTENVPTGFKEGIKKSIAGLTGGEFSPSEIPNEYGSGFGHGFGQLLGQGLVTAPAITAGSMLGGPLGGIGATALSYGATTPGNLLERTIEGSEAALIPAGLKGAQLAFSGIKKLPNQLKHIKELYHYPKNSKAIKKAESELQKAKEVESYLKENAHENFGTKSPGSLLHQAKNNEEDLSKLLNIVEENPESERDLNKILPGATGHELEPKANLTHNEALNNLENQEKEINTYLGEGLSHDVRLAKGINKSINENKKYIQKNYYNKLDENLEHKNVVIPNSEKIKQVESDVRNLLEKSRGYFKNNEEFEKTVKHYAEQDMKMNNTGRDVIPAKDMVTQWRTVRDLANEAKLNSRKPGIKADERAMWEEKAEQLGESEKQLDLILKNNIGEDYQLLKEGNKLWANKITPLYKNPLYWEIKKQGRINNDIIDKLRGTAEGQDLLRGIIKENPELLKHTVGQRYAGKAKNLHVPDEEAEQYIKELPQLVGMRNRHKLGLESVEKAKTGINYAQTRTEEIKKEADRIEKSFLEQKQSQEKRTKALEEIPNLKRLIDEQKKMAQSLKEAANKKNISLKEKLSLEQKQKEAKNNIYNLTKTLGKISVGSAAAYKGAKKIGVI